jgi:LuxR family maltose regulon positive regulatory protein
MKIGGVGTGNAANTTRGMIYREAVIKKMNRKSAKKNLFITAPGGYGKTTAAEQWLSFVRGTSARLRMGNEDNNTGVFYKELICSLLKLVKKEKSAKSAEFMLDTFLETLKQMPVKNTRCYLLIDDLHLIKNNDILNSLPLIAGRLPSYVCLCLVSRSMPPQPLLDTGLFETLTKDDLLFSQEEVEWLGTEKKRELTAGQINDLLETTGGWAMYLSALLSGEQTYKTPQTLVQYLETRVWNVWDDETKKLLVKLAVPVEITPDLCEQLTTEADGKNILERLVKKEGVFLTLIGNGVYRFHDIFRDFLLERTALLENQEIRRLNDVTAEWYYERGDYHTGAQYYIRNNDHEGIIRCLAAASQYHEDLGVMSVEAFINFTIRYVKDLPAEFISENPYLIYKLITTAYHNGDMNEYMRYSDMLYEKQAEITAKYPTLLQTFTLGKIINPHVSLKEHAKGLLKLIEQMPKTAANTNTNIGTMTQNLPFFHRSLRDLSECYELKAEDLELFKTSVGVLMNKDYEVMERALFAGIYYERGQLMDAVHHALIGKEACLEGIHPETRFSANMILAAVLYAMGDFRDAGNVMAQTEIFVGEKARFLYPNFKALQTERAIRLGDRTAAEEWLAVYANNAERLPFYQICRHFTSLRSYIALEDYKAAVDFGKRIQQLATDYKRPLDSIESTILTAIALWKKGDKYNAASEMEQALLIAKPYGFIQLFINEGKEILPLLWMIRKKTDIDSQKAQFIDTLTQRISGFDRKLMEHEQAPRLSVMRRKMLEYLNKGMSYNEIADKTGIVRGTVKRHILLLYKQLGVNSGEEAVIKAKMLGLLE